MNSVIQNASAAINKMVRCKNTILYNSIYNTVVLTPCVDNGTNVLLQSDMNTPNTKYVIKYNFSLAGRTITMPPNCILEFDGGSLQNGTIIGDDTYIIDVGCLGTDVLFGDSINREGTWRGPCCERLAALEALVRKYHPEDEPSEDTVAYILTVGEITEELLSQLDTTAAKPKGAQKLTLPVITKPTMMHLIYPLVWETVEDDVLVSPKVLDSNGWEQGGFPNEELPTVDVNGKTYRVLDMELGVDNYTIEFI